MWVEFQEFLWAPDVCGSLWARITRHIISHPGPHQPVGSLRWKPSAMAHLQYSEIRYPKFVKPDRFWMILDIDMFDLCENHIQNYRK